MSAEPLHPLHIALARRTSAAARVIGLGDRRRVSASAGHFVKIPFSSALDHSGMINGHCRREGLQYE
jgi:hypothetical protein